MINRIRSFRKVGQPQQQLLSTIQQLAKFLRRVKFDICDEIDGFRRCILRECGPGGESNSQRKE